MDQTEEDRRTLAALLKRNNETNYPRARLIKQHLEEGQTLSGSDLTFLHRVIDHGDEALALIQRNPDFQELATKSIAFYNELLQLAIDNESGDRD